MKENSDSIGGARDASDWRVRKEGYLAAMPCKSAGALRVSLADKLHNARSILS